MDEPTPLDPSGLEALTNVDQLTASLVELSVTYGVRILGAFAVLILGWYGSGWAARLTRDALLKAKTDRTVTSFLATLVRWIVRLAGVVLCLGIFGIEATSLAALLGGAGVAIGIALKGNLSNLASGLLLLAFRPFKTGDWIVVDGAEGRVARLSLLQTEIDSFDNARHLVPNSHFIEQGLTNNDHHPFRRVDVEVGVSYDTDLHAATKVLRAAAEALNDADAKREPTIRALRFGASSIDFLVGVWRPSADYLDSSHVLILALKDALDDAEIEIPFPQRDLHLRDAVALPLRQPTAAK